MAFLYIAIIVILILVIAWLAWKLWHKPAQQKGMATMEKYQQELQDKKEQAKAKIMEMLAQSGRISNQELAKALGVSDMTCVRYFDELEKEGKIKQVGKTGKEVYYTQN